MCGRPGNASVRTARAIVPSPGPGEANDGSTILGGVAAVAGGEAWAVGLFDVPDARQTLILHHAR